MTLLTRPPRSQTRARAWPGLMLVALALGSAACDTTRHGPGGVDPDAPWFEFGHLGQEHFPDGLPVSPLPFDPLEDGDTVDMIAGGQGLEMFALPMRAGNFDIDIANEEWPILDMYVDVEGHNDGVGGHFTRLANYPVWFDEGDDGDYAFFFLTIILPANDPLETLVGLPATIDATLEPHGEDPIALEVDFVVGAAP